MAIIPDYLDEIRRVATIAMVADDDLMNALVLKGANALDIAYGVASRASFDLDFSIENTFEPQDLKTIEAKIRRTLKTTFHEHGYEVFDVMLSERPKIISEDLKDFWGGYLIEFKLIRQAEFLTLEDDLRALRRQSLVVGPRQKKKFEIEISKFEYCDPKVKLEIDGYAIYVYTPAMLVFEKLRAICQQTPEYADIINSQTASPRARDFFDIYTATERFFISFTSLENRQLIELIFAAKRVPLNFLPLIEKYREFHRSDFQAVELTTKPGADLKDFDFYFDYVVSKVAELKPLWVE